MGRAAGTVNALGRDRAEGSQRAWRAQGPWLRRRVNRAAPWCLRPMVRVHWAGRPWSTALSKRNATAAVVGAGDFIGSAIANKFAAEGFTIFAGRRNADKLAPLVAAVESAGGTIVARGLDARKEDDIAAFLRAADAHAPLEVCIFNVGGNVNFPLLDTTERVFRKVWELGFY